MKWWNHMKGILKFNLTLTFLTFIFPDQFLDFHDFHCCSSTRVNLVMSWVSIQLIWGADVSLHMIAMCQWRSSPANPLQDVLYNFLVYSHIMVAVTWHC